MPYRPENELKRPDLKGEFLCGHCGKTFCHAASLNRHRLNFHGDDQQCLICMQQIPQNATVRMHMQVHHGIARVFTCGCCNWTFPDKKELHSHNNSMLKTGKPGEATAIAISSKAPGSLSQHELRGEERSPSVRARKKSIKAKDAERIEVDTAESGISGMLCNVPSVSSIMNPLLAMQGPNIPVNWISALILNNPSLLPLLQQYQMQQKVGSIPNVSCDNSPPSTSSTNCFAASLFNNNDYSRDENETVSTMKSEPMDQENDDDSICLSKSFARNFLSVKTDAAESSTSSGPESGIGSSGDDVFTPSPCSMRGSKEGSPASECDQMSPASSSSSPLDVVNLLASPGNRKRKSVDAIASLLFKRKCLAE